jgi:hypothetical protein
VDVSLHHDESMLRPWRLAAIIAAAVAAVELLLLVVIGGALIAKPSSGTPSRPHANAAAAKTHVAAKAAPVKVHRTAVPAARLTRSKVTVLVLNGNGRQGAAAAAASRVSRRGYRVGNVANAPRSDFTRSLVMYRKGFEGEGRRLARDLGIRIVGPLDGLNASQLHGANAVLVVGA